MAPKNFIILLSLFCGLQHLSAQDVFFRTVSVEDGLSNNYVRKIYKDKRGFIWLGTLNGLDRFDGLSFKSYISSFEQTGTVYDLLEITQDGLFVATDNGLWFLNYDDEQLYPIELPTICRVQCLAKGEDGLLLAGTNQGLFVVSGQKVRSHILPDERVQSATNDISGIFSNEDKTCWLATGDGLFFCNYLENSSQIIRYQHSSDNFFRGIVKIGPVLFMGTSSKWNGKTCRNTRWIYLHQ